MRREGGGKVTSGENVRRVQIEEGRNKGGEGGG